MDYKMEAQVESYHHGIGNQIADIVTGLVAAQDCTVSQAFKIAVDYTLRQQEESFGDVTGAFDASDESKPPTPSRAVSDKQFKAVRAKVLDQAMEAAEKFH